MKMLAEYLERAINFELMAAEEKWFLGTKTEVMAFLSR
jgi:hypothetical protein